MAELPKLAWPDITAVMAALLATGETSSEASTSTRLTMAT
jgi:hypothetical protein